MKSMFEGLAVSAQSIVDQAKVLASDPKFAEAYEAYVDDIDFRDRYGTRRKDLTDEQVAMLVMVDSCFVVDDEGRLTVEGPAVGYEVLTWVDGAWVDLENEVES